MDATSLRAKGVAPISSRPACLPGWRLRFNVEHFFRFEGGVGNIERTGNRQDRVLGIVHDCSDADLAALDRLEARGVGYDRILLDVETDHGTETCHAYVGLPDYINDTCLPTRRYLNILVRGAEAAGLAADYIDALQRHPVLALPDLPQYDRGTTRALLEPGQLTGPLTALAGHVFDMTRTRPAHVIARDWFSGKDVTLFLLRRMDSSDGRETLGDIANGRLSPQQNAYINRYLHAFDEEYEFVGKINSASLPAEKILG